VSRWRADFFLVDSEQTPNSRVLQFHPLETTTNSEPNTDRVGVRAVLEESSKPLESEGSDSGGRGTQLVWVIVPPLRYTDGEDTVESGANAVASRSSTIVFQLGSRVVSDRRPAATHSSMSWFARTMI